VAIAKSMRGDHITDIPYWSRVVGYIAATEGAKVWFYKPRNTSQPAVAHGDDDQIVPYADAGPLTAKIGK
jgi:hypothetical protein